jgi:hypothetical protein
MAAYALWFLRPARRRAFLVMFGACTLVCWVLVRPASLAVSATAAAAAAGGDDGLLWLDGVNLFGLVAVVAGVLNAEGGLFARGFSSSSSSSSPSRGGDEWGEEDEDGFELREGEEREDGRRRREGEVEDEESRTGSRSQTRGDGRRGDREGADGRDTGATGDVGLGYLSLAGGLFGV